MSGHSVEEIRSQIKTYIFVFIALAFLTTVTVCVSYLKLSLVPAVTVALCIATLKAGLVAAFFMHLTIEKRIIHSILIVAVFLAVFLLIWPSITHY